MTTTISLDSVAQAIEQLSRSGRGRTAMKGLLNWLDGGGVGLDPDNQAAVVHLLEATWGPYTGTARDLMREAIGHA